MSGDPRGTAEAIAEGNDATSLQKDQTGEGRGAGPRRGAGKQTSRSGRGQAKYRTGSSVASATPASGRASVQGPIREEANRPRPNSRSGPFSGSSERAKQATSKDGSVQEVGQTSRQLSLQIRMSYCLSLFSFLPTSPIIVHQVGLWLFGVYVRHKENLAPKTDSTYEPSRCPLIESCCPPFNVNLSIPGTGAKMSLIPDQAFVDYMDTLVSLMRTFQGSNTLRMNYTSIPSLVHDLGSRVRRLYSEPGYEKDIGAIGDVSDGTFKDVSGKSGTDLLNAIVRHLYKLVPSCCVLAVSPITYNFVPTKLTFEPFYKSKYGAEVYFENGTRVFYGPHVFVLSAAYEGLIFCAYEIARRFSLFGDDPTGLPMLNKCREYCQPPYGRECAPLEAVGTILQHTGNSQMLLFPGRRAFDFPSVLNPIMVLSYVEVYNSFRTDTHGDSQHKRVEHDMPSAEKWLGFAGNRRLGHEFTVVRNTMPIFTSLQTVTKFEVTPSMVNSSIMAYFDEFAQTGTNQNGFSILFDTLGRDYGGMHGRYDMDHEFAVEDDFDVGLESP